MATKKYLDYAGLTELVAKIKELLEDAGKLEFKGSVATVNLLPTLSEQKVGWMYTVQAEGETTADFVEGAGERIAPNSEVAVVDISGTKKWALLGPIFDVSDKLSFGSAMPANPEDGQTFLYLGNTTYTYHSISDPDPDADPAAEGWYVSDGDGGYTPATDHEVQDGTTYFTQAEEFKKGVIYVYNESGTEWIAQPAGDVFVAITNGEVDALFA